jgi:hypothetical protein
MQEWYEFANKNELTIIENGNCQLCRSKVDRGIVECIDIASQITHQIDHNKGIELMTIFLCVDSHALQHSEIHGRWNNHFHLTRLNLILNRKIKWTYKLSPVLSNILDKYKVNKDDEIIRNPAIGMRGRLTVRDVANTNNEDEYVKTVWSWAEEVINTFKEASSIINDISDRFINNTYA